MIFYFGLIQCIRQLLKNKKNTTIEKQCGNIWQNKNVLSRMKYVEIVCLGIFWLFFFSGIEQNCFSFTSEMHFSETFYFVLVAFVKFYFFLVRLYLCVCHLFSLQILSTIGISFKRKSYFFSVICSFLYLKYTRFYWISLRIELCGKRIVSNICFIYLDLFRSAQWRVQSAELFRYVRPLLHSPLHIPLSLLSFY